MTNLEVPLMMNSIVVPNEPLVPVILRALFARRISPLTAFKIKYEILPAKRHAVRMTGKVKYEIPSPPGMLRDPASPFGMTVHGCHPEGVFCPKDLGLRDFKGEILRIRSG